MNPLTKHAMSPGIQAVNGFCPVCAVEADVLWRMVSESLFVATGTTGLCDNIEPLFARMLAFELRTSAKGHGHVKLITQIVEAVFGTVGNVDDYGVALTEMLELNGVRFHDYRVLKAVRSGFTQRAGVRSGDEAETDAPFNDLLNRVSQGIVPLDPMQRAALSNGNALLHGLDLFADGDGTVLLVTCLRVAILLEGKRVPWTEAFYLWKTFTPAKADDLLAYVSDPRVTARDIEKKLLLV